MDNYDVGQVIASLSLSMEGLDAEIEYHEYECLDASSIVALSLIREGWSYSLIRGVLYYKDGTIVVPHYWISLNVNGQEVIIDLTLHSWVTNVDALSGVCVFTPEMAETAGLRYQGEPSPEDINDIDSELLILSEGIFYDPRIAKSLQ